MEVIKTKAIEGLYIGVCSSHFTTNKTATDDKLNFCIWRTTTSNQARIYIPIAPEYIFRLDLLNTNGVALPKTKLGKMVGAKFWDLKPSFANDTGFKLAMGHAMDREDWGGRYLFFPFRTSFGDQTIYAPDDLFEINQPGQYSLQIYFQIIVRTGQGHDKTAHIVRFPPLIYPLIKQMNSPRQP